jgi:hypothetical protein
MTGAAITRYDAVLIGGGNAAKAAPDVAAPRVRWKPGVVLPGIV